MKMHMNMDMKEAQLYIYWGMKQTILFDGVVVETGLQFGIAMAVIFLAGFFMFSLKRLREKFIQNYLESNKQIANDKRPLTIRLLCTFIFTFQLALSVLLMLTWMTYNGWTILASSFGLLFGYICFESGTDDGLEGTKICVTQEE